MKPSPYRPHPCPERALYPGDILYPSMRHRIDIPAKIYRDVVRHQMILIKEIYGIHYGDTLHISSAGGDPFTPSGRSFFAYVDDIITGEGIKDGYALITLHHAGAHEPWPWYSKQDLERFPKGAENGNA